MRSTWKRKSSNAVMAASFALKDSNCSDNSCNSSAYSLTITARAALDDSTNGGYLAGWTRVPTGFRWGIDND